MNTTGPAVRVTDIAFVRFAAPDLDEMEQFLLDFGLQRHERTDDTLYMRGTGREGVVHVTHREDTARFVGVAFAADVLEDLETLSRFDDFGDVTPLSGPQGGSVVTATDPDGFSVEVVAGRDPLTPLPAPSSGLTNTALERPRRGQPLRLDAQPSHVVRIGHCVLNVSDFVISEQWYKLHLGLVTSDQIDLTDDKPLGAFLRCDRGDQFVDHHTLFLLGTGTASFNHAAFEVAHFDDLMAGHTHLAAAGHRHQWGIGRHILGSQIYDYWLDPYGNMVEHWTDGDLFNDVSPAGRASLDDLIGSQWGPTSGGPA